MLSGGRPRAADMREGSGVRTQAGCPCVHTRAGILCVCKLNEFLHSVKCMYVKLQLDEFLKMEHTPVNI